MTAFYVVRPFNSSNWNTLYRKEVIEAETYPIKRNGISYLKVIKSVENEWPKNMSLVPANSFVQCRGPVRLLNFEKYVRLVHDLLPKITLPNGFDAWGSDVKKVRT